MPGCDDILCPLLARTQTSESGEGTAELQTERNGYSDLGVNFLFYFSHNVMSYL
jgi:hypothetical protein